MTTKEIIQVSNLSVNAQELAGDDLDQEKLSAESYLQSLQRNSLFQDAVSFHAHELPVKSSIDWAAACVEDLRPPAEGKPKTQDSLDIVKRWLAAPEDRLRWAAKESADHNGVSSPADCLAMAVFFSGGSIAPLGAPDVPPPPYAAQKMAAGSIIISVVSHQPENSEARFKRALTLKAQGM